MSGRYEDAVRFRNLLPAGLMLWVLIVGSFIRLAYRGLSHATAAVPIDAQIIELPPAPKPAPKLPSKPRLAPQRTHKPVPKRKPRPASKPIPKLVPEPVPRPQPAARAPARPRAPRLAAPVAKPAAAANTQATGAVRIQARPIYQPMPRIPDELRDKAMHAEAIAQLYIRVDGTVHAVLINPTPLRRLNRIILDKLNTWRYFPALYGGQPVSSIEDIRIHIEIR